MDQISCNRKTSLLPYFALLLPGIASIRTITQPDFWLHVALGQSGVARSETFSLTNEGAVYVDSHWLYNLVISELYGFGGGPFVILSHTAAILLCYVLLIFAARRYTSGLPIAFAVILSAWLMLPKLDVRPVLLAAPFIALILYGLETKRPGIWQWILLGVGQWFWMGFHPSFLLGPILCLLYAISGPKQDGDMTPDRKRSVIGILGVLGVTFLNPYGLHLHLWVLSHSPVTFFPDSLTNLSPISDLLGAQRFTFVLYTALFIAGSGLLLYREKLPTALTVSAAASAFLTATVATRLSYHLLAILGFLFFAISFQSIGTAFSRHTKQDSGRLVYAGSGLLILLILSTLLILISGNFFQHLGSASRFGLGINDHAVSDDAIQYMQTDHFPKALIHLPVDGGKLKTRRPDHKIFIDQRTGAYPPDLFVDLNKALLHGDPDSWHSLEKRFDPKAVLINLTLRGSQHGIRLLLELGKWKLAYADGISAVLISHSLDTDRIKKAPAEAHQGLHSLDTAKNHFLEVLNRGQLPPLPLQLSGAGRLFLVLNRYPQANLLLELSFAAAPKDTELLYQLGISRYHINDMDRAEKAFIETVSRTPKQVISWLWLARTYEKQGKQIKANQAFTQAYALNPEAADQMKVSWGLRLEL